MFCLIIIGNCHISRKATIDKIYDSDSDDETLPSHEVVTTVKAAAAADAKIHRRKNRWKKQQGKQRKQKKRHSSSSINREEEEKDEEEESYRVIDGRRYHNTKNSVYPLPADEAECDRLRRQHRLYRHIWQSHFSAPVEHRLTNYNDVKVLDIGCGPGTWITEMSAEYPRCHFTGVDISPIMFPESNPENTQFTRANILKRLPFDDNTFDFVHMQFMCLAFTAEEWEKKVLKELLRVTKPGGWIEIMEQDVEFSNLGSNGKIVLGAWLQNLTARNIDPHICGKMEKLLSRTAQLHNITVDCRINPVGVSRSSDGVTGIGRNTVARFGKSASDNFACLMRALEPKLSPAIGVSTQEYQELIEIAAHEFSEQQVYQKSYRFCAQKLSNGVMTGLRGEKMTGRGSIETGHSSATTSSASFRTLVGSAGSSSSFKVGSANSLNSSLRSFSLTIGGKS